MDKIITTDSETRVLKISEIVTSDENPRRQVKKGDPALAELTESIKTYGVLQAILVRPKKDKFEIIAGERRYTATKAAGLEAIPAKVIDADDRTVSGMRLVENLQRQDLNPIEEAESYKRLHEDYGYSVEEIAKSSAKSAAYVRQRFKLTDLPKAAGKAVQEGKISPAIALLIARIPDVKTREMATDEILTAGDRNWNGGTDMADTTMTYAEAQNYIEEQFMTLLSGAPFPTDDAELLPEAGACLTCPKRTGLQKDLFADVTKDSCTDLPCYEKKKKAHSGREIAKAKADGLKVLTQKDLKKELSYGGHLKNDSQYINLNEANYEHPGNATWKTILGKDVPETEKVVGVNEEGRLVELVTKKAANAILKEKKPKWFKPRKAASSTENSWQKEEKAKKQRALVLKAAAGNAIGLIVQSVESQGFSKETWKLLVDSFATGLNSAAHEVVSRRKWGQEAGGKSGQADDAAIFQKHTCELNEKQLQALVIECYLSSRSGYYSEWNLQHSPELQTFAKAFKLDLKKLERQIVAAAAGEKKSRAKKTKAAAK